MRPWIKAGLLIMLIVGLSWGGAIWYWQATNRMPGNGDMLGLLVGVPLAIVASLMIGRLVFHKMTAPPSPAATATANAPPAPAAPAVPALALLASAVNTAHGTTASAMSGALVEGKARGELDAALVDDAGFPVMSVRNAVADDGSTRGQIAAWFAQQSIEEPAFTPEQWRALSMATDVAAELAGQAMAHLASAAGRPPMLYLQPILPPGWDMNLRSAAGQWLRHVVIASGWPEKQLTLAATVPVEARGASPGAVLARLAHQSSSSGLPLAAIVLACDSHVGQQGVETLAGTGTLFSAARPQGRIPGEGAAGLLLSDLALAASQPAVPHAVLHHAPETRRHNSADESKKADSSTVSALTGKLLADTGTEAASVGMLVADTDHRSSRVMEVMQLASASLPHLDANTEVLRTGAACGNCGAVPFVAALAVAHHHATELAAPVLCISNDDPYRRSVVLIRPAAALS